MALGIYFHFENRFRIIYIDELRKVPVLVSESWKFDVNDWWSERAVNDLKSVKRELLFTKSFDSLSLRSIFNHPRPCHRKASVYAKAPWSDRVRRRFVLFIVNRIHESRWIMIHHVKHCLQHKAAGRVWIHSGYHAEVRPHVVNNSIQKEEKKLQINCVV